MPAQLPRYPSRDQVAHYLHDYAESKDVEAKRVADLIAANVGSAKARP